MSDSELCQTMKRLMSIHDEIDEKKLDLKTVYADAKSAGYDKTALGLAIRQIRSREKNETPAAQERSAIVDLYVSAFDNAPRTYVHVPAREASHEPMPHREHAPATQDGHDVDRGASAQPHSAIGGPAIPSKAGDAGTGQAVCDEAAMAALGQPSGAGTGSAVRAGAPVSEVATPDYLPAAQSEAAAGSRPEQGADERASGDGVAIAAQSAQFVTTTGEEEGRPGDVPSEPASSSAAEAPTSPIDRKPFVLRPHCQRPELCGSYGSKHCGECERLAKAAEDDDGADVPAFVRKTHDHIATGEQA